MGKSPRGWILMQGTVYVVGMGRFTNSHRCIGIKAHDAMARIKIACTEYDVGWNRDASFLISLHRYNPMYWYRIMCMRTPLVFRNLTNYLWPIILYLECFLSALSSPLLSVADSREVSRPSFAHVGGLFRQVLSWRKKSYTFLRIAINPRFGNCQRYLSIKHCTVSRWTS